MFRIRLLVAPLVLLTVASSLTPTTNPGFATGSPVVAAWSMDEAAGGSFLDSSGSGFDGTLFQGRWPAGVSGTAIEFNGQGGYGAIDAGAPAALANLSEGTISLWFRFDDVPTYDTIHPLFYFGDGIGGPGNSELIIEIGHFDTETTIFCTIITDNEKIPQCFNSKQDLVPGELYHFAVVVDELPGGRPNRGTNTGYLNGAEMTDRHYRFGGPDMAHFFDDIADAHQTWFGRGFLSTIAKVQSLNGLVDEVFVLERPLNAQQISAYYQATKGRMEQAHAR